MSPIRPEKTVYSKYSEYELTTRDKAVYVGDDQRYVLEAPFQERW
jgi:hypothetical protein